MKILLAGDNLPLCESLTAMLRASCRFSLGEEIFDEKKDYCRSAS